MRDDAFITRSGIVNLHLIKETHWVIMMFVDKLYFDSFGCPPPVKLMIRIIRGISPEYENRETDSY